MEVERIEFRSGAGAAAAVPSPKAKETAMTEKYASHVRKVDTGLMLGLLTAAFGMMAATSANAGLVTVPNSDFLQAGNAGTVGGGLVNPPATNVPIGTSGGPWTGNYSGVLTILAPPTLTIDSGAGTATISGIAGLSIATIINNGGYFNQTLSSTPYVATKRYTVWTNITSGELLDLGLLTDTGVGVALRSGGTTLASSATAGAGLVNLSLLGADLYRLTLVYDTGASVSGNVDIALFDQPAGLLTASLVPSVSFSKVGLNVGAITDSTTQMQVSGLGSLSAEVNTPFAGTLKVLVTDAVGNPQEGVIINADAPAAGASAVLTSSIESGTSIRAVSGNDGIAEINATANEIAGCYNVTATLPGSPSKAVFHMRNWSVEQMARFSAGGMIPYLFQDSIFCDGFE